MSLDSIAYHPYKLFFELNLGPPPNFNILIWLVIGKLHIRTLKGDFMLLSSPEAAVVCIRCLAMTCKMELKVQPQF